MHIFSPSVILEIAPNHRVEKEPHLVTNAVGAQLLAMCDGEGELSPLRATRNVSIKADGTLARDQTFLDHGPVTRLLFMRAGGFGDLVLLTPVLREIKRRWPSVHIGVSTMLHYAPVLENLPFVDEILPFPLPCKVADTFDAWVFYENAIEKNPRAQEVHMSLLFAEIAGVSMTGADMKPAYGLRASESLWAAATYPRTPGVRRACIQVKTSAQCRNYAHNGLLASELVSRGWEVMLMGERGQLRFEKDAKMPPTLRNLCEDGLTFRQSCAVVAGADVFIGPDSALLHIAGALGTPAVGLYAAFPWSLRTAHSPSIFAIQGTAECAPCFHHPSATMRNNFPEHCPTKAKGFCGVLAEIDHRRVVAKAELLARPLVDAIPFINGVSQ